MANFTITDLRTLPGDSAFLLDDGCTAILYDTGFGFTGEALVSKLNAALGRRSLNYIFLTHSHYDHALGSAWVTRAYPDAQVVAHSYAADVFSRPSARDVMNRLDQRVAQQNGITNCEDVTHLLRVDIPVADGDTLICGEHTVQIIGLAGHTRCSIGFYLPEEKLLLGTETLGVCFGEELYLPSYLVGYGLTTAAFAKVRALNIEKMLLPHYGIADKAGTVVYLERSEQVSRDVAMTIKDLLLAGKTHQQIAATLEETLYSQRIAPTYPVDAFRLNTDYMIELIKKELL